MKEKIITIIIIIIMVFQLIVGVLDYLNIKPKEILPNIGAPLIEFFLIKIQIYWIIFGICIMFFLYKHYQKKHKIKNVARSKYQMVSIEDQLSQDAKWALLELLDKTECTDYEPQLQQKYFEKFNKKMPDFNLLKDEMTCNKLISIYPGSHYSSTSWRLLGKGREIARKIYKPKPKGYYKT